MSPDRVHDPLEERVPGGVTMLVVGGLEADDVDIGDRQHAGCSARTIDLVVHVRQSGGTRARPRQGVGLAGRQLGEEGRPVCLSLRAVTRSLFAIPGGLLPVCGGPGSPLSRRGAVGGGSPSILRRPHRDVRPLLGRPRSIARVKLAIMQRRGVIARCRRQVPGAGYGIACSGRVDTRLGSLPAPVGALLAKVARAVVHGAVGAVGEVAIARLLVGVRRSLVAVGGGLVAVSN